MPETGPVEPAGPPDMSEAPHVSAERVEVLGQLLESVDLAQAAEQVLALVRSRRGGYVVTLNVDHVVKLQQPGALRDAYDKAALRYADGTPIVWLARCMGSALPARVAGSDLVPLILERAGMEGLRVHLVGGAPEVAAAAAERVRAAYPGLVWTGHVSPPRGFESSPELDAKIAAAVAAERPHIVLACLGAPKQEAWALRHSERLGEAVVLCVGATVDFLAGTRPRAPRWMVRLGLEWLFRLAQEPRRLWRRYLIEDAVFLQIAVAAVVRDRLSRRLPGR